MEKSTGISSWVFILVVVVVVILVATVYFASVGVSTTSSSTTPAASQSTTVASITTSASATTASTSSTASTFVTQTGTTTASAKPITTVQVSMPDKVSTNQSLSFQPRSITIVIGVNNTVMWTNNDAAPHTVTAVSVPSGAAKFNSGNMNPGATFTYTFNVPGTYTYDCAYHYWMTGTVIVEN